MQSASAPDIESLLAGCTTISARIRALDAAGYPRAEIARLLGKRYQHVRNVLERPGAPRMKSPAPAIPPGMAERDTAAFTYDRPQTYQTYQLEIRNGLVALPTEVLAALGAGPNGMLSAELDGEFFKIISVKESVRRLQNWVSSFAPPGVSLVDEFIAERRSEAAAEDREYDEWRSRNGPVDGPLE